MGRVCVVGSCMMDIVVRAPRRPADGETVIGDSVDFYLGGKGFNQAIAAVRSGASTAMIGRVGRDAFGDRFLTALADHGIDASHVSQDPDVGTGTGVPIVDARGENAIVVVPQANLTCSPAHVEAAGDLIRAADVVLVQLELPLPTVRRALEIARAAGVRTVLNPAPMHDRLTDLAGLVDIVTPNQSEAATIIGAHGVASGADHASVAEAVAVVLSASAVILTVGDRGAVLWEQGAPTAFPAHPVDVVDTVGAGDALAGAAAAALAAGASLRQATRRGVAAGSLAVTVPGAEPSMPSAATIDRLLESAAVDVATE